MNPTLLSAVLILGTLSGCHDDDVTHTTHKPVTPSMPSTQEQTYKVTINNLMANQPLSPVILLHHTMGYQLFTLGSPASDPLERLAEGGETQPFIHLSVQNNAILSTKVGKSVINPSTQQVLTLTTKTPQYLSLATMLTNTNDGFGALNNVDLSLIPLNRSVTFPISAWDSGTENNTETQATVPHLGGQGFHADRNDINQVGLHPGVISRDDGLPTSDLSYSHRFQYPIMTVTISRIQ